MISQLTYFFACIGLGFLSFCIYLLMRLLAKKTNLVPVTIILDFLWCGMTFAAFLALNVWLKDGQPYYYAFCGAVGGYFLGMLLWSFVPKKKKIESDDEVESGDETATEKNAAGKELSSLSNSKNTKIKEKLTKHERSLLNLRFKKKKADRI